MLTVWDPFSVQKSSFPVIDVLEDKSSIHLIADLAGVRTQDIKVEVDAGVLTLSGERARGSPTDQYQRSKRFSGRFSRSFTLPDQIDHDRIEARHENGVLSLRLPKGAAYGRRSIPIVST